MDARHCCCHPVLLSVLLLALIIGNYATAAAAIQPAAACPIQYSRHSLDDIRSRAKTPYLLGGIYDEEGRNCTNCKRGGLWADFCGFKPLGKSHYYDMQLCSSSTVDAVVDVALKQDNAVDLLTLTPCDIWPYLKGRTTWIIGDSMSKDLFKALRCFLIEFQDLNTYHATNNFTAMHLLEAIPGKGEPRCVHMLENSRLCQIHAIEGDLFVASESGSDRTSVGGVLPLIQQHLAFPDDVFILHFGLWHGETRQKSYKKYLHQLGQYYQSSRSQFPHMFFMETPKQHFDSADGDYKVPWIRTRKGPWTCQPIQGVSLNPDGSIAAEDGNEVAEYVAQGSWRNQHAREVLAQYGLPLLPIYNVTVPAWDFHRQNLDGQECSHFCHPSLPQFWLWHMLSVFKQQQLPVVDDPWQQIPKSGCAIVRDWEENHFGAPKPKADVEKEARQQAQSSFWDWLLGRSGVSVKDGVVVPPLGASTGMEGGASVSTWEVVQKLLDLRVLQQPLQPHQQPSQQQQQQVQQEKQHKGIQEKGMRHQQQQQRPAQSKQLWQGDSEQLVVRHTRKKQQQQQQQQQQRGGASLHPMIARHQAGD